LIDYDFQGFVNNKYIVKAKNDKFSVLAEADSLEDAQTKAKEKLIELNSTVESKTKNTQPPQRKILSKGI